MKTFEQLQQHAYQTLLGNSSEEGFTASGRDEIFGCFFGRDSVLTILKILRTHIKTPSLDLLEISRRSLLTLANLQGKEFNFESGEQPGKFIHEFRKGDLERLLSFEKPWFVYPDNTIKNYDSIDSTPLGLIAIHSYYSITQDSEFLLSLLPNIEAALNWIITYGDLDKDGFIEYDTVEGRTHGGLVVQSWTDSHESLRQPDGNMPKYPIAPVEAQGYAWLALKLWGTFYLDHNPTFGQKLLSQADFLKKQFNKHFIIKDSGCFFAAQALDGDKNKIKTITSNPLICLWSSYYDGEKVESIIDDKYIQDFVDRSFMPDLFNPKAGFRTMSTLSKTYKSGKDSYHNGSFWPVINGLIHEGLENFNYIEQAFILKNASLEAISHFEDPIELYVILENDVLDEYCSASGTKGCRSQSWSAAAMLDWLT